MRNKKVLVIEREPAPYKFDLWNAFGKRGSISPHVLFMESKNWLPDGSHDFQYLPKSHFRYEIFVGRNFGSRINGLIKIYKKLSTFNADLIYICGYSFFYSIYSIILSIIFKKKFVVFVDCFNCKPLSGKFSFFRQIIRKVLRIFVFRFTNKLLVCGKIGVESAIESGCPKDKILDFPYVVDEKRLASDLPSTIPENCLNDLKHKVVILFSGRLIERKGLPVLLNAYSAAVKKSDDVVLWVEGRGPEQEKYLRLAENLNLSSRIRFLGFCQFDMHSWLVRNASIIVVPSLQDNWGIVVDEGLTLGKIVISTANTGSAMDRIKNGINGFIYSGEKELCEILKKAIKICQTKDYSFAHIKKISKIVTPEMNRLALENILREK